MGTLEASLAKLAIEEGEGPKLANYHATMLKREERGPAFGSCYMPRNKSEFLALSDSYEKRQLPFYCDYMSNKKILDLVWLTMNMNIHSEIYYRFLDRRRELLDKYLKSFAVFVSLVDECKKMNSPLYSEEIPKIGFDLWGTALGLLDKVSEGEIPKEELEYLVASLDHIFENSIVFKEIHFLSSFKKYSDESFFESAEYKAMCEMIVQMFSNGISITKMIQQPSNSDTENLPNQ